MRNFCRIARPSSTYGKNSNNSMKIDKMLTLVILALQYIVQLEMKEFLLFSGLYGFVSSTLYAGSTELNALYGFKCRY